MPSRHRLPTRRRHVSKGAEVIMLWMLVGAALAGVGPLLTTAWGQGDVWQAELPVDADGAPTVAGCTTVAAAQVLHHYRWQAHNEAEVAYLLDHDVRHADIEDRWLSIAAGRAVDWDALAVDDGGSRAAIDATSRFLFQVGATLNAQFGDDGGTPATGKQLENAFRLQWGYRAKSRRAMSVIARDAFGYDDREWADLFRAELDAGRPVLYMALQADGDAGHAFVVDGYDDAGRVHVNWGWGGHGNGWVDPLTMEDPSGRRWNREPMVFRGLEPTDGYAAALLPDEADAPALTWTGNGSLIAAASGARTGYGLTRDEAYVGPVGATPTVFFQWEVDPADGRRLRIGAETGASRARIVYGTWDDRSADRAYTVDLPFVLDPAADGHAVDGQYFVVAVTLEGDHGTGVVTADATHAAATPAASTAAAPVVVDDLRWSGNGSVIGYTSGTAEGYGLTHDLAVAHPGDAPPAVFFQWEIDGRDGRTLVLDAPVPSATVAVGAWNADRSDDVVRGVAFPYTLDPASLGLPSDDGTYLVVRVALPSSPDAPVEVAARAE